MSELIPAEEIEDLLKKIPEWDHEGKAITRVVEFDDYMDGIDFVNGIADVSEEANHHPEIDIRWGAVTLRLSSTDLGGLTDADFDLAKRFDNLID